MPHLLVLVAMLLLPASPLYARTRLHRTRSPATVPTTIKAVDSIISLPLNPVVPAAQRLCGARTSSGLGYTMLRMAAGAKPAEADLVLVNYIGYLAATGVVFDQGMRTALPVNGVIPGFSQGLRMMARTGVARFCIPATMGYGAQASGPIPANSDLVFQVELVDYRTATATDGKDIAKGQAVETATQKDAGS